MSGLEKSYDGLCASDYPVSCSDCVAGDPQETVGNHGTLCLWYGVPATPAPPNFSLIIYYLNCRRCNKNSLYQRHIICTPYASHSVATPLVNDLRQSRRLEKGGTAQSGEMP